MQIDRELHETEVRVARRRRRLEYTAHAAKERAVRTILSPAGILGAAGIGLLATVGLLRKRSEPRYVYRKRPGKLAALGGVLGSAAASAAFALLRAQFGSPAQMAQLVLARLKKSPSHAAHGRP
jgi:hypothetical protein